MPYTVNLNYKGLGVYADNFSVSVAKYSSVGGYYDLFRKNQTHSLKLGLSIHFNYRISYEYLFKFKNRNFYIGTNFFFVRPQYLKSLISDMLIDLSELPDEKYTTSQ